MNKRVLCILADGFEEIEAVTPIDLLRRADCEVVLAGISGTAPVTGRCGVRLLPEISFAQAISQNEPYAMVLLPGGPAVAALRADEPLRAYIHAIDPAAGTWLAAICAAPLLLLDAGKIGKSASGVPFTAHSATLDELPESTGADLEIFPAARIITSKGAGTALDFGLALVRILAGEESAQRVADAIHFRS